MKLLTGRQTNRQTPRKT